MMGLLLHSSFRIPSRRTQVIIEQKTTATTPKSLKRRCLVSYLCNGSAMTTNRNLFSSVKNYDVQVASGNGAASAQVEGDGIGIVEFLRGKAFFVTGATGFLAKVFIEKLLRTIPEVGKIYLLIKAKDEEAAFRRFRNEILNEEIFKCLQQTYGESYEAFMLSKLVPVVGNLCETGLGLTQDSTQKIIEDVDVIIHSAANTNFHERYDSAIEINTLGPNHVMDLAKQCKKLKLFLQVSTAYVNGQRQGTVLERPFRWGESITMECFETRNSMSLLPVLDVEHEVHLALKLGEDSKDREAKHRMIELGLERARKHGWQDTYVFTKAMGEMLLGKARGDVPLVILRPSVIESTYNDPFPGWIEGHKMMAPIIISYGRRRISGFLCDPNSVLDVVPVDMVVNTMLAAIAKHGLDPKPDVHVYQVTSSVKNPLTFRQLCELLYEHFTRSPWLDSNGLPIEVNKFKTFSSVEEFSSEVWRETVQHMHKLRGSNGNLSELQLKACRNVVEEFRHLASMYQPYSFYGGRFDNSNTESLMEIMSEEEKKIFYSNVESIDWKYYISNVHIPGTRKHVMKGRGLPSHET